MKCLNKLIKVFILVGIWLNTLRADVPPTTCVEKGVLNLLEKMRQGDKLPLPLPPIEEINIPSFEGQYAGFGIKMTFETGEMKLAGVKNFTVEELIASVNNNTLEAFGSINFPLLTLVADNYSLKGHAYVFYPIKGSGVMNASFDNAKLLFGITLGPQGEGTQIKDIQLNFTVDHVKINLAGSSWPVNKVLNSKVTNIIDSYHTTVVDAATEGLKYTFNKYLAATEPAKLVTTFVGNCTVSK